MITPLPAQTEAPAVIAAREIIDEMNAEMQRRAGQHQKLFAKLWSSPDYTAAEVLEVMGTRAKAVLEAAAGNVEALNQLAPHFGKTLDDYLRPEDFTPPLEREVHEDGTVTIKPAP